MSDSPSAPPAPDYVGAANATAAGNIQAAQQATVANRVNQITPYGSLIYSRTGGQRSTQPTTMMGTPGGYTTGQQSESTLNSTGLPIPQPDYNSPSTIDYGAGDTWTATQTLAPAQQALLDQQNKTSLGLAGLADRGLGYVDSALSHNITSKDLPADMVNPGQTGQDALMSRFQPQIDQSDKALETQLANQGITLGSEAYNNAKRVQGQNVNDLRMQAALNGINVGQNAQNQQFGLKTAMQNQPLNMLNAVRTGSQVTNPTFGSVPQQGQTQGADRMAALDGTNKYQMGLYNSQIAQDNANTSATVGLAGSALAAYGAYAGAAAMF